MVRRSIWHIAAFALLGPCLTFAARAADDPQKIPSVATARPPLSVPNQELGADSLHLKPELHPKPPLPVPDGEITAAMGRGVNFLLKDQNSDGSWGSAERTKDLNIMAGIGSHHAFRTAVTSLCVSALIEVSAAGSSPADAAAVRRAIKRGEEFLFRELPLVRRDDPMLIYNIWAHAYAIQALVRMHGRLPLETPRRARIAELIRGQFDRLTRYEAAEGGWGYYDFGAGTQRPNSESCSFVNATVLVAFHEAKQIGVSPPEKLVRRGVEGIIQQRNPDFSYLYGLYLRYSPMMAINRPGGSLGRSQACNIALRLWGDAKTTDAVLTDWLDRLIVRNGWLDMGRKRPIPHESHFMVAGYFYYYGHYYATLCVEQLPKAERPFYQDHLAHPAESSGARRLVVGLSAVQLSPAVRHGIRSHVARAQSHTAAACRHSINRRGGS